MNIALGYKHFQTAIGYYMERAIASLGHDVHYLGLPTEHRPGYDSCVMLGRILDSMEEKPSFYLWVDPLGRYFPPGIEELPVPTACYLVDVHLGRWRYEVAKFFDVVFVAQKDYLEQYRKVVGHSQVFWLPLAAAPEFHQQMGLPRIYDVGFVGNIARAHRSSPRARRLKLVARTFRTNDFYRSYSAEEVGRVYSQSKIVFNTTIAGDVTMRIFEGTMAGAMVLTDSRANGIGELFRLGKEIVVYDSDDDLVEKIRYYLSHEDERNVIAEAGHERTMAQHSYRHRMETIIQSMSQATPLRIAPMRRASARERAESRHIIYTHLHMVDTILDAAQENRAGPLGRLKKVWPALLRRLIV